MARLNWTRLLTGGALVAMLALASGLAFGQTPSAAQMEAFRNLPPDQQKNILENMGATGQVGGVRRDRDVESPETVRARTVGEEAETGDAMPFEAEAKPREPRIRAYDTVLIDARVKPRDLLVERPRTAEETARLQGLLERALRGNPYRLDAEGQLRLPGVAPMALSGLTEKQATERLNLDPLLRDFEAILTLLPLEKHGVDALKPFGYDLFAGVPSTFAPVSDIPIPSEYVVGPGDRLEVQLIGNTKSRESLVVNRDGRIMLPELGPISVAGLKFDAAKARIEARVSEQMIGTQAIVSMGDLRSIRIFVLGEAERPGSYTVSGLASITNALFASGGVKPIGSLRNIQLKRNGMLVQRLDLYDLLLQGDTSNDVRLLPGDVIFIPPVGSTVGVTGEIRRPAIYEIQGESTAADLIHLGGGLTPEADPRLSKIERIDASRDRVVLNIDLSDPRARGAKLRAGDLLRIPAARPSYASSIQLKGHVHRPSSFEYLDGMRLTDVLPSIEELKPNADASYVVIRRQQPDTRYIQVLSADLTAALHARDSEANPRLQARDQIVVFDLEAGRDQYLKPIMSELVLQSGRSQPTQVVRVTGRVRFPGEYPLQPGMRISDLVRAGGGLAEQAFDGITELARYEVRDGQTRQTDVVKISLAEAIAGNPAANILIRPFDLLVVKEVSEWAQQDLVRLEGEVRFPGEYPIERGETLRSVVSRAGGLTPLGFARGSIFTRETLKAREREQIRSLAERMRQDLAVLALQSSQGGAGASMQASESLAIGKSLLTELEAQEPVGRLVIDLERVLAAEPGSIQDLSLRPGDRLRVPRITQEVTIIGEVQNATSHVYEPGRTRDDYLQLSGGVTKKADAKRIYVVHANGSVESGTESRWFRTDDAIQPGDTVVVPLDAERMRPLSLWTSVTTIIYNLAVAVAAIGSL